MIHPSTYPPFAMTVWVPIMTLFTLAMMANIAESVITVVSMFPFLAKLTANS